MIKTIDTMIIIEYIIIIKVIKNVKTMIIKEATHMEKIKTQITAALKALGVKGTVSISPAGYQRYQVELNEEYFGIFDVSRNTFVD